MNEMSAMLAASPLLLLVIDPHSSYIFSALFYLINNVLIPAYSLLVLYYVLFSWYRCFSQSTPQSVTKKSTAVGPEVSLPETCPQIDLDKKATTTTTDLKLNLSGTFKLIKHDGFEEFLAANGVPYLMRRAALSMQPVHTITHNDDTVRVQISGIISGDITYHVNGPSVESTIHTRTFLDTVTYLEEGDGIRITKHATDGSNGGARQIVVTRRLVDNNKNMLLTSTSFFNDDRPSIQYTQLLERQSS